MAMIRATILLAPFLLVFAVSGLSAQPIFAQAKSEILEGAGTAAGEQPSGTPESNIETTIDNAVDIFSVVVGIASVIMIIYGGFRYVTSGGDSGKIQSAKNTVVYAVIGLVVVALSQTIVYFVIRSSSGESGVGGSSNNSQTQTQTGQNCVNRPGGTVCQ